MHFRITTGRPLVAFVCVICKDDHTVEVLVSDVCVCSVGGGR